MAVRWGQKAVWKLPLLLPASLAALWLGHGVARAGTITVVDGPDTPPVDGVYTDGYVQAQLASGSLTLSNNVASVTRNLMAAASLIITKSVVGAVPGAAWQFNASGGITYFALPAVGGSKVITGLIPATYAVIETTKSGYDATVACTNGASGNHQVNVTLTPGQTAGCTFTNTQITQTLTVNKVVVGGFLGADAFPLFVDGEVITRGVPTLLATGVHTVSEGPLILLLYRADFGGACNADGRVNLAAGAQATCTITNTFSPPELPDLGAVSGRVYEDLNDNRQADEGEGLAGVTVILQSGAGATAAFTRTDVTNRFGRYEFLPVPVNVYTLYFVPPEGYSSLPDEIISVGAGETVEVPDRVAIKAPPGKIYLPVLRR
jgi:hypothetical protein